MGISKWHAYIVQIVMRLALKGIITGVLLALARVAGETAPLLFTAFGNNLFWNHSLSDPISALPLQIFNYAISPYDDWHRQALGRRVGAVAHDYRHQRRGPCPYQRPFPTKQPMNSLMPTDEEAKRPTAPDKPAATRPPVPAPAAATPAPAAANHRARHRRPGSFRSSSDGIRCSRMFRSRRKPTRSRPIIGPSGCGKSTFSSFSSIACTSWFPRARMEGEIRLFGQDILQSRGGTGDCAPSCRHGVPEIKSVFRRCPSPRTSLWVCV